MGRVLTVLGVLTLLVGIAGTIFSVAGPFLNLSGLPFNFNPAQSAVDSALEGPQAEDLCEPGEQIVTEGGQSERGPTGEWRHPVRIYCVDDAGNRRDVTENFAGDLVGQAFDSLPGFLGGIGLSFCFSSLIGLGIVLMVIGLVVSRRRQPQIVTVGGGAPGVQTFTVRSGTSSFTRIPHSQMSAEDLTGRLRQLEDARNRNLISDEEYERLRKQILDSMG